MYVHVCNPTHVHETYTPFLCSLSLCFPSPLLFPPSRTRIRTSEGCCFHSHGIQKGPPMFMFMSMHMTERRLHGYIGMCTHEYTPFSLARRCLFQHVPAPVPYSFFLLLHFACLLQAQVSLSSSDYHSINSGTGVPSLRALQESGSVGAVSGDDRDRDSSSRLLVSPLARNSSADRGRSRSGSEVHGSL